MTTLNPHFWQEHFDQGRTPWDRGAVSPQLLNWLNSEDLRPCRIAVPGCGKGWEVVELARRGFDVTGIDYTTGAVKETGALLLSQTLTAEVIQADVLSYMPNRLFDAVYEQTCLCAIDPDHWISYATQLARWLKPGGYLYILFMQVERPGAREGLKQGPPFHCDINAMHALFNASHWQWPDTLPTIVPHPTGWHELAICLERK
jgi:SAM-dependent methyltransferase